MGVVARVLVLGIGVLASMNCVVGWWLAIAGLRLLS